LEQASDIQGDQSLDLPAGHMRLTLAYKLRQVMDAECPTSRSEQSDQLDRQLITIPSTEQLVEFLGGALSERPGMRARSESYRLDAPHWMVGIDIAGKLRMGSAGD
jgi:hypothetical protein